MNSPPVLLLVDVQQDYLDRPDLVPEPQIFTFQLAALLAAARSRGWPVMHSRTLVSGDGSDGMAHWRQSGLKRCIVGTQGAEAPLGLRAEAGEYCFRKRHFSAFEDPALLPALRASGAGRLIIAGAYTHACIRATVLDAYAQGFMVFVPRDGVASYDPDHAEMTLGWLQGRAAQCLPVSEILAVIDRSAGPEPLVWQHHSPTHWPEILDSVPVAREAEVEATARRIRVSRIGLSKRVERLTAWQEILAARKPYWTDLLIRDIGKPRADAAAEIDYGLGLLGDVCGRASDEEAFPGGVVRYRPHGLVGLITPWNNPFAIPVCKIAAALAYGNGVLWKPALPGSRIAHEMLVSLVQAGLGESVGLVTGDALTGQCLVKSHRVSAVAFTGSVAAGRQLAEVCGHLAKPLQAELGGNNAAIVMEDADVGQAAQTLAQAMFSFAGQRCTALRRVIVARPILAAFQDAFIAATEALKLGYPDDATTQIGPVISKDQQKALLDGVNAAVRLGGKILTGGHSPAECPDDGCWVAPTVMTDLPENSPILTEEHFGPVVALIAADSLEEAIDLHNGCEQGLFGVLFSNDAQNQARFLERAEAGILAINQARPAFSAAAPFSGWKASGFGLAEHGRWSRDFYTRVQAVYIE